MSDRIRLEASWRAPLAGVFEQPFMADLKAFLQSERSSGKAIAPPPRDWFRALDLTPLPSVRVVILGQDPYHGPGQAHGLCFSVLPGVPIPPSLRNIYKELQDDIGLTPPAHGNLEQWAKSGVLLLNSVLTVELGKAGSHAGKGWEKFTDAVVRLVAEREQPTVFMLWGRYAQMKASAIQTGRHLLLKAPHPSPLSAHAGFLGCRHFSQASSFLQSHGLEPVDWTLPQ